jgi:hypothetical protein
MKRTIILVLALVLLLAGTTACGLFGGAEKLDWEDGTLTASSDEIKAAATVSAGDFYNPTWFDAPPLIQKFKFEANGDWQFTITASGEVDTNFEIYVFIELRGGPAEGYAYDQLFTLDAETETFNEDRPLAEGQEPPVNVEVKVLFDAPMDWEMVIEEVEEEIEE